MFIKIVSAIVIASILYFKTFPIFKKLSTSSKHKNIQKYCDTVSANISYENNWWKNLRPLRKELDLTTQIITLFCIFAIVLILLRSWSIIQLFDFGGLELLPLLASGLVVSLISGTFLSQGKQIFLRLLALFGNGLEKWHDEMMALVSLGLLSLVIWGFILHLPDVGKEALKEGDIALEQTQYIKAETQYKKALIYLNSPSNLDYSWFNSWVNLCFPFQQIQNYLSLSFTEQQNPLALFKLGYAYYKQLDLDKAQEYYISAINSEDNKEGVFYMKYLTNLAKVLILKSYGLSSADDNLDYSATLGDKDADTLLQQKEFINRRRMRDAKFFLEKSASIYRKNIINDFSQILGSIPDDKNCKEQKNYNLDHASMGILRGLINLQEPEIITSNESQKCQYMNNDLSIFLGEKAKEYEEMKDIDWYIVDRNFYNIQDTTETQTEILSFLKKEKNQADGLFMEYLEARRDLAFVYGMYELSYFQQVTNGSKKPSYTLMNKLKEAKTHFRVSSFLGSILEPTILRELEYYEVDGILNLKMEEKPQETPKTETQQIILEDGKPLFSSTLKTIDDDKSTNLNDFKEDNPQEEILKPLCYYRLSQFLSISTIKLLKDDDLENFYQNRNSIFKSQLPDDFNDKFNKYIDELSHTGVFEKLIEKHRKPENSSKSKKEITTEIKIITKDGDKVTKETKTVNLEDHLKTVIADLNNNLYGLPVTENGKQTTLEKYLNEKMVKDTCDIEDKVPIEVLDWYERKMMYDLRRIPGLPENHN
ncbi:MAG: hypothetical protein QNJ33_02085 [Crocosphaera sp.]|nr:hypothetical protein [Crocosphaera sp.]